MRPAGILHLRECCLECLPGDALASLGVAPGPRFAYSARSPTTAAASPRTRSGAMRSRRCWCSSSTRPQEKKGISGLTNSSNTLPWPPWTQACASATSSTSTITVMGRYGPGWLCRDRLSLRWWWPPWPLTRSRAISRRYLTRPSPSPSSLYHPLPPSPTLSRPLPPSPAPSLPPTPPAHTRRVRLRHARHVQAQPARHVHHARHLKERAIRCPAVAEWAPENRAGHLQVERPHRVGADARPPGPAREAVGAHRAVGATDLRKYRQTALPLFCTI